MRGGEGGGQGRQEGGGQARGRGWIKGWDRTEGWSISGLSAGHLRTWNLRSPGGRGHVCAGGGGGPQ